MTFLFLIALCSEEFVYQYTLHYNNYQNPGTQKHNSEIFIMTVSNYNLYSLKGLI